MICNTCYWCDGCSEAMKIKCLNRDDYKISDICEYHEFNDSLERLIEDEFIEYTIDIDRGQFKKEYDNYLKEFYEEV